MQEYGFRWLRVAISAVWGKGTRLRTRDALPFSTSSAFKAVVFEGRVVNPLAGADDTAAR